MEDQIDEKKLKPNSGLEETILYTQKRQDRLTRLLEIPGVPLDNNLPPSFCQNTCISMRVPASASYGICLDYRDTG